MRAHSERRGGASWGGRLAARGARRRAVAALYLSYPALLGCIAAIRGADDPRARWLSLLLLPCGAAMILGLAALLTSWVWGVANRPDSALDERQRRVRDRAYLHAYQGLGALVIFAGAYGMFARDLGWWLPSTWVRGQALFWGATLLCVTLPAAIVAWTEPDLPVADD